MNKTLPTIIIIIAAILLLAWWLAAINNAPGISNMPTGKIETDYYKDGPFTALSIKTKDLCDQQDTADPNTFPIGNKSANNCWIYYPSNLGTDPITLKTGFLNPIITWGNGTDGNPRYYDYFFRHLASWGFVVVASEDPKTGDGNTILNALQYMKKLNDNSDPNNVFHGKLNKNKVAAVGFSQGAGSVILAATNPKVAINTVISIELPAEFCLNLSTCPIKSLYDSSIFFVSGSADFIISPASAIKGFYNIVPSTLHKLKGILIGPYHADITGQPDCASTRLGCAIGVYGYLGYPTAWLMSELQDNANARKPFNHNPPGEMFLQTNHWEKVESNL